jgi:pilus assembly protein Flp/PilA
MYQMINLMKNFLNDEEGATAVEYGVLIALIIAAVVVIIAVLGGKIKNGFDAVNAALGNEGL